jgi:hypothetical protein
MPQKKSAVTRPGIDPGTFRLVAQRLNHYATPGPQKSWGKGSISHQIIAIANKYDGYANATLIMLYSRINLISTYMLHTESVRWRKQI